MTGFAFSADFSSAFATDALGNVYSLLDMLKKFLGIETGDPTNDPELEMALNMAGTSIETWLDRAIYKRQVSEFYAHHFGTVALHHPEVHPSDGVTVVVDGSTDDSYKIFLNNARVGILSRIGHAMDCPMDWRPFEQVEVRYTAGYDPLPADLANAIVYTAADIYNSQGTGEAPSSGDGLKALTVFDVGTLSYGASSVSERVGYGGVIPDTALEMILPYRRKSA